MNAALELVVEVGSSLASVGISGVVLVVVSFVEGWTDEVGDVVLLLPEV